MLLIVAIKLSLNNKDRKTEQNILKATLYNNPFKIKELLNLQNKTEERRILAVKIVITHIRHTSSLRTLVDRLHTLPHY